MSKIKYCPYCGNPEKLKGNQLACNFCGKQTYINNSPAVGVFIVNGGKVLLSKRKKNPKRGYWDYPGGFLNFGEHPMAAAKRELKEETGTKIKIIKLLGVYINKDYEFQGEKVVPLDTVYVAKIIAGKPEANDDVSELKWFPIEKPPAKIAFACVDQALEDLSLNLSSIVK